MNVSDELKQKAISLGLCREWTDAWGNPDRGALVEMFVEGIDFCIEHNYPSIEYIKKHFKGIAEEYGVYTDDSNVILKNPDIAILNGKCTAIITLDGYASRDIHVRHDSQAMITIEDSARAFIRVYDNAKVFVNNLGKNKVFVYKNGNAKIETSGDVLIRKGQF